MISTEKQIQGEQQMSTLNPTKYYSSKQEKMIADYLGWSVVIASGARAFLPGDVRSDNFLGECKTHTQKHFDIAIYKDVWRKISGEAVSVLKRPVLFIDNGTQMIKNTWCIIQNFLLNKSIIQFNLKMKETKKKLSFSHDILSDLLDVDRCAMFNIHNESLLLMKLETFKNLIESGVI